MKIDCHIHTTLSDWNRDNIEAADIAKYHNVDFLVCTDHDIVNKEASALFEERLISSCDWVELSVPDSWVRGFVHILCYSNQISTRVCDILENFRTAKFDSLLKCIETLTPLWFIIDKNAFRVYYDKNRAYINDLGMSFLSKFIFDDPHNSVLIETMLGGKVSRKKFLLEFLSPENNAAVKDILSSIRRPDMLNEISSDEKREPIVLSFAHPNNTFTQMTDYEPILKSYMDRWISAVEINANADVRWVKKILEFQKKYDYILTFWSDCHFRDYEYWYMSKHAPVWSTNPCLDPEIIKLNFNRFLKALGRD